MEVVKIVMLGMTGVCLGLLLKETKPEYAVYISLAVGVFIFSYMTEKIAYLFSSILKLREYLPLEEKYLSCPVFFRHLQGCRVFFHCRAD